MKKQGLKVVCLAATKGGVGKTTLTAALAVKAAEDGSRVCIIDADPQSSLERWWELRQAKDNPKLVVTDASPEGIGLILSEGYEWAFIDTPPAMLSIIRDAIEAADLVLIPARASALDVLAVDEVVELCQQSGKAFAFVLNAVITNWGSISDSAQTYLENHGKVCSTRIVLRKPYTTSMTVGKSGAELDKAAKREIDGLWAEIKKLLARPVKARAHANG